MEIWLYYALMAAIFISIRDIISLDFIKRYDYIQYMVIANILIFIGTIKLILRFQSSQSIFLIVWKNFRYKFA